MRKPCREKWDCNLKIESHNANSFTEAWSEPMEKNRIIWNNSKPISNSSLSSHNKSLHYAIHFHPGADNIPPCKKAKLNSTTSYKYNRRNPTKSKELNAVQKFRSRKSWEIFYFLIISHHEKVTCYCIASIINHREPK